MVHHIHVEEEEMKAIFIDTNINTHLLLLVSPFSNFDQLKDQIIQEHKYLGNITINCLKVPRDQKRYHLSQNMLLKTAFHGFKIWSVYANVDWVPLDHPPKALSIPVRKLELNMANHEHVLNPHEPNDPSTNFEVNAGDNNSPGDRNHSKSKSEKKKRSRGDFAPELSNSSPLVPTENIRDNALEKPLLGTNGLMFSSEGGAPKPKQLVSKKDKVETCIGCETMKKKMRYGHRDTAGHVHNASVSTDAKGTPALVGQLEGTGKISGSIIDPESVVHNSEAIFEAPPKKVVEKITCAANLRNVTKQKSSKPKQKKPDHPSSNLMTVEKADLTPNHKVNDVDSQEKVSLHENTRDGSTEVRKPCQFLARKSGILRPNLNARSKSSATSSLISVKSAKIIHKEETVEAQEKKNGETVFKTPSNKNMGRPLSSTAEMETLPASSSDVYSDSSDGEDERSGSSCNIGIVYDSSSSDSSEGESEGDSKGSRSARDEKKLDLSALEGIDMASVLRRSNTYKKALQSQMEDGETEPWPVESVPDSYSD